MEEKKDRKLQEHIVQEEQEKKIPLSDEELEQASGGGNPNNGHRR